jgi:hypothetical protein
LPRTTREDTLQVTVRWRFGADFAQYMDEDDRQFGRVIRLIEEGAKSCAH